MSAPSGVDCRREQQLAEMLDRTAADLLALCWVQMYRDAREALPLPADSTPLWSVFAKHAFRALELTGADPDRLWLAHELRPWTAAL